MNYDKATAPQDLKIWLKYLANEYDATSDNPVLRIANSHKGYLTQGHLIEIFRWKLQPNHFVQAERHLKEYASMNPKSIREKTRSALLAGSDIEALESLRGLPQMKTKSSVAVASCLLMVLDIEKYTVMDRRANETLVSLLPVIQKLVSKHSQFRYLEELLTTYSPPIVYLAVARDWEDYMKICRELARLTDLKLRELDRSLYTSSGDISLLGKLR
jgi:hypothetical protein